MKLALELPDTAELAKLDQQFLVEGLIALLYHKGKLSEKEACEALGMTRRTFEDLLPRFGFSILADDAENIDIEISA